MSEYDEYDLFSEKEEDSSSSTESSEDTTTYNVNGNECTSANDPISLESFEDLNPELIVAIKRGDVYQCFYAPSMLQLFVSQRKFENPLNRQVFSVEEIEEFINAVENNAEDSEDLELSAEQMLLLAEEARRLAEFQREEIIRTNRRAVDRQDRYRERRQRVRPGDREFRNLIENVENLADFSVEFSRPWDMDRYESENPLAFGGLFSFIRTPDLNWSIDDEMTVSDQQLIRLLETLPSEVRILYIAIDDYNGLTDEDIRSMEFAGAGRRPGIDYHDE